MNFPQFVSLLIFVGILIWFAYRYIPMNKEIRKVLPLVLAVTITFGVAIYFDVFNFGG